MRKRGSIGWLDACGFEVCRVRVSVSLEVAGAATAKFQTRNYGGRASRGLSRQRSELRANSREEIARKLHCELLRGVWSVPRMRKQQRRGQRTSS